MCRPSIIIENTNGAAGRVGELSPGHSNADRADPQPVTEAIESVTSPIHSRSLHPADENCHFPRSPVVITHDDAPPWHGAPDQQSPYHPCIICI